MLELSGICKSYRRQNILDGVELTVRPGECVGIVGYNGCGKTTLLSIIAGALKADKGSILFNGRQAVGHPRVFAEEAAYVPQENPLMEELTVRDNLKLWYRGSRTRMEEDLRSGAAAMLGVDKMLDRTAGKLSGGMKKRVSIACALSNHAPVLIMDEPTRGIDVGAKYEIYQIMIDLVKQGKSIIMISSEMPELLGMSNRIIVMCNGKITGDLEDAEATQEKVMSFATQFEN